MKFCDDHNILVSILHCFEKMLNNVSPPRHRTQINVISRIILSKLSCNILPNKNAATNISLVEMYYLSQCIKYYHLLSSFNISSLKIPNNVCQFTDVKYLSNGLVRDLNYNNLFMIHQLKESMSGSFQ